MSESDSDSSSDTAPRPQSPGPVDPQQCTVTGTGFTGGAAGESVSLTITSKDALRLRVREGGYTVVVSVNPSGADGENSEIVQVVARDNSDGTYSASYSVPSRGNYTLNITMNGTPIGGSPFPVFFSPPQPGTSNLDSQGNNQTADGNMPAGNLGSALANLSDGLSVTEATQALGGAIVNAVYATNISPNVQIEQLKQLFSYCGKVADVHFIGEAKETALVEYTTALEARCATGLDGTIVGDRPLRVQLGTELASTAPSGGSSYLSLQQVHQLQHVHSSNQHASQLAAQLAGLRAIARTALLPAIQDEEKKNSGRKAAMAAAAELSRKLICVENTKRAPSPYKRQRSRSNSRSWRRRKSQSPPRRRRSRSRSRNRAKQNERKISQRSRNSVRSRRSRSRSQSRSRDRSGRRSLDDRHRGVRSYSYDARSPRRSEPSKGSRVKDRNRERSRRESERRESHKDNRSRRERSRSQEKPKEKGKSRDNDRRNRNKSGNKTHRENGSRETNGVQGKACTPEGMKTAADDEEVQRRQVEDVKEGENGDLLEEMRIRALQAFKKRIPSDVSEAQLTPKGSEVAEKESIEVNISLEDDTGGDMSPGTQRACGTSDRSESPPRQEIKKRNHREHRKYRKTHRSENTSSLDKIKHHRSVSVE